jgi:hypothetical protein
MFMVMDIFCAIQRSNERDRGDTGEACMLHSCTRVTLQQLAIQAYTLYIVCVFWLCDDLRSNLPLVLEILWTIVIFQII